MRTLFTRVLRCAPAVLLGCAVGSVLVGMIGDCIVAFYAGLVFVVGFVLFMAVETIASKPWRERL
jgi:hypothetical protein